MVPNGGWELVAARKHRTAEQIIEHQRHDWAGFPPPHPVEDVDDAVVTLVTICCLTLGKSFDRFDFALLFLRSLVICSLLSPSLHCSKLASLPLLPQPLSCAVNGPLYPPSLLLSMATAGVMISNWLNFFPVETRTAVALAIVDRVVDRILVKLDVALCTAAKVLPLPPLFVEMPPVPVPLLKLLPATAERMLLF